MKLSVQDGARLHLPDTDADQNGGTPPFDFEAYVWMSCSSIAVMSSPGLELLLSGITLRPSFYVH
jgi:hypothetical protein